MAALPLDAGAAGSVSIPGFGSRWSRATLMPTIAEAAGAEVPLSYGATLE